ncbi:MAG TPA: hypothetical protein VMU84_10030, partial [Thermoanaerobaculia bacterium]|nr:hypothetical protein [Thermoanaerobaculia bacterium]
MRDDFSEATKRVVALQVGHRCSRPECRAQTSGPRLDPTKALSVGCAAHITAASPGGPRYDKTLQPEQRKSIENAIWLCETCSKLIDVDADRFPVQLLRDWKAAALRAAIVEVGKTAGPDSRNRDDIVGLIKKFNPQTSAEVFFREGYDALRSSDPNLAYVVSVEEGGVTVTVRSKDGEPVQVAFDPIFADTPEGRAKAAEFENYLKTGTAVELDESNLPVDELPEIVRDSVRERGGGPFRLQIGPKRPRTIASAIIFRNIDGKEYEFSYLEFGSN